MPRSGRTPGLSGDILETTLKRSSYHHGDLRRVLLDASLALVNEAGVAALSLREVARKAGVSHNAPYHHFPDKGRLLAAIALEGFEKMAAEMEQSATRSLPPRARLEQCGLAYIRFALACPAHFRVMFRPELASPEDNPEVIAASSRGFAQVISAVVACQDAGLVAPGDPMPYVLTCWSAVHGLASLWLDGPLSRDPKGFGKSPEKLAQVLVTTLGGLIAGGAPRPTPRAAPRGKARSGQGNRSAG